MLTRVLRRWNHYEVLGVPMDANQLHVKQAFYRLAKKYHPDASSEASSEKFKEITEAYKVLSDQDLRSVYDRKLAKEQSRAQKRGQSTAPPAPEDDMDHDPEDSPYTQAYSRVYDSLKRSELREARMKTGEHLKDPMYKKSIRDFARDATFTMMLFGAGLTVLISPLLMKIVTKEDYEIAKALSEELQTVQEERNTKANIGAASKAEHSFLSGSESELSQDLQAVYSPAPTQSIPAAEKDVQTIAFDPLPLSKHRFYPLNHSIIAQKLILAGQNYSQTRSTAQLHSSKPKLVRLKRSLKQNKPQIRSISAQRSTPDLYSREKFEVNIGKNGFEAGKAELPPMFPISNRRSGEMGVLVTSKAKRKAVMETVEGVMQVGEGMMVLAFQPRTQVYSASLIGPCAPLSPCCHLALILTFLKSGTFSIHCSNQSCASLLSLPLTLHTRQQLWIEENFHPNNRVLSSTLSLFIQRGEFKVRPIRRELDRVRHRKSRPGTTVGSVGSTNRRLRVAVTY